jgi:hypothetical protein
MLSSSAKTQLGLRLVVDHHIVLSKAQERRLAASPELDPQYYDMVSSIMA